MEKFIVRSGVNDAGSSDSLERRLEQFSLEKVAMRSISAPNLRLSYGVVLPKKLADELYSHCESNIEYNSGELATVQMFGKTVPIPRRQTAYGDHGLTYTFSGNTLPANPWPPLMHRLCLLVSDVADVKFNFVLVNRYKDGQDYVGAHRDGEKDLDRTAPIASLTLGAARDFVFQHQSARKRKLTDNAAGSERKLPENVKLVLEHGSLLLMHPPTNSCWYHSLPGQQIEPTVSTQSTNAAARSLNYSQIQDYGQLKYKKT
uniref:DNA oxidative demethylase ALKBH2 n=1 Tax=Plectus sambesii TaxID=2011161 RepID=A0A914X177_9BILA